MLKFIALYKCKCLRIKIINNIALAESGVRRAGRPSRGGFVVKGAALPRGIQAAGFSSETAVAPDATEPLSSGDA